jgi:glycerol uptake facilitator-like aquaporin
MDIVWNYKLVSTIAASGLLYFAFLFCAIAFARDRSDRMVNASVFLLGIVLGWLVGTALAPYTPDEQKEFSLYASYVSTFFSGYLLAKIDPAVTKLLSPDYLFENYSTVIIRIASFLGPFIITLLVTFIFRKYGMAYGDAGPG